MRTEVRNCQELFRGKKNSGKEKFYSINSSSYIYELLKTKRNQSEQGLEGEGN